MTENQVLPGLEEKVSSVQFVWRYHIIGRIPLINACSVFFSHNILYGNTTKKLLFINTYTNTLPNTTEKWSASFFILPAF